jgi:hypothetical protein
MSGPVYVGALAVEESLAEAGVPVQEQQEEHSCEYG